MEACWAHNPDVGRSKLPSAKYELVVLKSIFQSNNHFKNTFITKFLDNNKQSGAVKACWAHNPEVRRSKLRSAKKHFFSTIFFLSSFSVKKILQIQHEICASHYSKACPISAEDSALDF